MPATQVDWARTMVSDASHEGETVVELGPGRVLASLGRQATSRASTTWNAEELFIDFA